MIGKPKIAFYWASSCGGCEISLINLHEKLLLVDNHFDLVFCPCIMDTKRKDVEAMPDGSIAITFFNGAIRTRENEEMAILMRKKSGLLIAFGACAAGGGIPALSNFHSRKDHFDTIYLNNPSIDNPDGIIPGGKTTVPGGEVELPDFFEQVRTLAQTVPIDYIIPGCPPETHRILEVIEHIINGKPLPPRGSVIGAGTKSVCDECARKKNENRKIERLVRCHEVIPDTEKCLLEQGLFCMGVATRDGCGALCPTANMPCTGCYGPPDGVSDQGAKMAGTIGGLLNFDDLKELEEQELSRIIDEKIARIPDFPGMAYKFSLADSILKKTSE
ncbi:MAG: hypothetical protein HQM09_09595 [Candidatus Riflebacteria bacterium]|nr:hypothetical protein [Candidatus Riflebacteria bacterium]